MQAGFEGCRLFVSLSELIQGHEIANLFALRINCSIDWSSFVSRRLQIVAFRQSLECPFRLLLKPLVQTVNE